MSNTSGANQKNDKDFIFHERTPEEQKKITDAEKKVKESVEEFAKALDSVSPWLTKELLDIFDKLKQIWWIEETTLWKESFKLLYSKNTDKMPDKLRHILWEMLKQLTEYELVKQKSRSLEEMLRACASISAAECCNNVNIDEWWLKITPETHDWWRWKDL